MPGFSGDQSKGWIMKRILAAVLCGLPVVATLFGLSASPRAATYVFDTTENGQVRQSTAIVTDKLLCMTSEGNDQAGQVTNGAMAVFDPDPPTMYYQRGGKVEKMDQARIDDMKQKLAALGGGNGKMPDVMAMMQERLKNVPEAQRAMIQAQIEKMMHAEGIGNMGGKQAPKVRSYQATGKSGKVGKYSTKEYAALEDGKKVGTVMLTPVSAVPQGAMMMDRMQSLMDFIADLTSQFGMNTGITGSMANLPKGLFPVAAKEIDANGKVTQDMMLASVTSDTPDSCKIPK